MKNKVLVCSDEYPPDIGGAGNVAFSLLNSGALDFNEIDLFTKKKNDVVNSIGSVHFYSSKLSCIFLFIFLFFKYDYIFVNDRRFHFLSCFLPKIAMRKIIYFFHGQELETFYYSPNLNMKLLNVKKRYANNIKLAAGAVFVSDFIRGKINNIIELPVNNVVAYPSINPVIWDESKIIKNEVSNRLKIVFCTACRVTEYKGIFNMLECFRDFIKARPNIEVVWKVAGDGPDLNRFKSKVREYKLCDYIFTLGPLSKADLVGFYSSSDIFWLLSNYEESFGLVYLEAASFGLYTVGYSGDGVSEATLSSARKLYSRGHTPNPSEIEELIAEYKNIDYANLKKFVSFFSPATFKSKVDLFLNSME